MAKFVANVKNPSTGLVAFCPLEQAASTEQATPVKSNAIGHTCPSGPSSRIAWQCGGTFIIVLVTITVASLAAGAEKPFRSPAAPPGRIR